MRDEKELDAKSIEDLLRLRTSIGVFDYSGLDILTKELDNKITDKSGSITGQAFICRWKQFSEDFISIILPTRLHQESGTVFGYKILFRINSMGEIRLVLCQDSGQIKYVEYNRISLGLISEVGKGLGKGKPKYRRITREDFYKHWAVACHLRSLLSEI